MLAFVAGARVLWVCRTRMRRAVARWRAYLSHAAARARWRAARRVYYRRQPRDAAARGKMQQYRAAARMPPRALPCLYALRAYRAPFAAHIYARALRVRRFPTAFLRGSLPYYHNLYSPRAYCVPYTATIMLFYTNYTMSAYHRTWPCGVYTPYAYYLIYARDGFGSRPAPGLRHRARIAAPRATPVPTFFRGAMAGLYARRTYHMLLTYAFTVAAFFFCWLPAVCNLPSLGYLFTGWI